MALVQLIRVPGFCRAPGVLRGSRADVIRWFSVQPRDRHGAGQRTRAHVGPSYGRTLSQRLAHRRVNLACSGASSYSCAPKLICPSRGDSVDGVSLGAAARWRVGAVDVADVLLQR